MACTGPLCGLEKVTHCPDEHSPARAGLAPTHTSAHTCTAVHSGSDLRKVPKICRKRKGTHSTFSSRPFLWVFPKHSIPFWLHHIPAGRTLGHSALGRALDPGPWKQGAGPAPCLRILSQAPSWSERLARLPNLAPLQALAQAPASTSLPSVPTPLRSVYHKDRGKLGNSPAARRQPRVIRPAAPTEAALLAKPLPSTAHWQRLRAGEPPSLLHSGKSRS